MQIKDLKTLNDLTPEQIEFIINDAIEMKNNLKQGNGCDVFKGKVLAMIFQKPSTRTRVSFEVAAYQLGGTALYLGANDIQLSRGESVPDTARVLSRFSDGIMARVFKHKDIEDLAEYASVGVINGLSDYSHPCQILADLQTIKEKLGRVSDFKIAYVGDGNNVCNSWIFASGLLGFHLSVVSPKGYEPAEGVLKIGRDYNRGMIEVTNDPIEGVKSADVIYTDVWASMGQEEEHAKRLEIFKDYQINSKLVSNAKKEVLVMHCLPAHRGEEITDEVVDGPNSIVFDEAENRLHAQKAVMRLLLCKK